MPKIGKNRKLQNEYFTFKLCWIIILSSKMLANIGKFLSNTKQAF